MPRMIMHWVTLLPYKARTTILRQTHAYKMILVGLRLVLRHIKDVEFTIASVKLQLWTRTTLSVFNHHRTHHCCCCS